MKKRMMIAGLIVAAFGSEIAIAGPWEDGMAAYNRGDYVPAVRVFRAMAAQGNARAQRLLGLMYRRGEGVSRNPIRAFVWYSRAAAGGDVLAKSELREVTRAMTAEEVLQAREMSEACEASNYRNCEY